MTLIRLKYITSDVDRHGNVRRYYRKGKGRKVRLLGVPGSEEFMKAYHDAAKGEAPVAKVARKTAPESFEHLCNAFYRSAKFQALDAIGQRNRKAILNRFCAAHGEKPYKLMEARHIRGFRDKLSDKPGSATNFIKAMRHIFAFALEENLVDRNPAAAVPYLRKGGSGFHSWTAEECREFEAAHPIGTKARLAYALLYHTGQRRGDIVGLGKQHLRNGKLHFVQRKTRRRMVIKIADELAAVIRATPSNGLTFLETEYGQPYTAAGFGIRMREWCNDAGLPHCTAHGLRKALAARLAEGGASMKQIQDTLGHTTLGEAARYTAAADQETNADAAIDLLFGDQKPNKPVPLARASKGRGGIGGKKA